MKMHTRSEMKGGLFVHISVCFLILGFACQVLGVEEPNQTVRIIPEAEMPTILEMIANVTRENYEQIKTWSGEIDKKITWVHTGNAAKEMFVFTDSKGEIPNAILQKAEDKKIFAVDATKDFVYVDTLREKPSRYFNYNTGEDIGNSKSSTVRSTKIATPNYVVEAVPSRFEKGTGRILKNRAVKKTSRHDQRTGWYKWYKLEDIWDPRRAFFAGYDVTWNSLESLIKKINKYGKLEFDGYRLKMEEHEKGDSIEYKMIMPSVVNMERSKPEHYVIITKIFSSQCGFNTTYWESTTGDGKPIQKYSWEYEFINGVYLPKKVVEKIYDSNGIVTDEYDSIYKNNKVNQEISPETFTYKNLGLQDGDIFEDKIKGKEYKYEDANLAFVKELSAPSGNK